MSFFFCGASGFGGGLFAGCTAPSMMVSFTGKPDCGIAADCEIKSANPISGMPKRSASAEEILDDDFGAPLASIGPVSIHDGGSLLGSTSPVTSISSTWELSVSILPQLSGDTPNISARVGLPGFMYLDSISESRLVPHDVDGEESKTEAGTLTPAVFVDPTVFTFFDR